MLRHPAGGYKIKDALKYLPSIAMECTVTPITRTVLRVVLMLRPEFVWRDSAHGQAMRWILWVGDSEHDFIYYNEVWTLTKKMMQVCTTPSPQTASTSCSRSTYACYCIPAKIVSAAASTMQQGITCGLAHRRRSTGSTSRSQSSNPLPTTITFA